MMNAPIKVAIIGYGFSAKTFHIPFLQTLPFYELVAISSSRQKEIQKDWPSIAYYSTAEEMLNAVSADLVIITAPNHVHFPLAKLALENAMHVVVEKPFVTRVEQGEALIKLAKSQGKVLSVYHNRRWDGDFLTVKNLIDEKRLGHVHYFESHFDRFRPHVRQRWRESSIEGSGILFDLGPHLIDQALQLFGKPQALTAQCKSMRENSESIDFFHLLLHYSDKLVVLHSSCFSAGPNIRFQVQGDLGSYTKYGLDPQEERLIQGHKPLDVAWSDEEPEAYGVFYDGSSSEAIPTLRGGYQQYFEQLAKAIKGEALPPVTAEQALWSIKLVELALLSMANAETVDVPQ